MFNAETLNRPAVFWGVVLFVMALSFPMRFDSAEPDISWLIDMCVRMLNGETAFVDIFETTPPVPTLLYMPGVLLERITPLSAEAGTYLFAYATTLMALGLAAHILPSRIDAIGSSRWLIVFPAAVFLFLVSYDGFAQREYFAAAYALPIIAVFIAHAQEGKWPGFQARLWAALLGGLTIAIKPPIFIAPGAFLGAYYLFTTRNFRTLYSSGLIAAGAIGVIITAWSLAVYPHYLENIAPMMREFYVPASSSLMMLFSAAVVGVVIAAGGIALLCKGKRPPEVVTLTLVAAAGFIIAFLIQGKYWPYHLLPGAFLVFVAFWAAAAQRLAAERAAPAKSAPLIAVYAVLFSFATYGMSRGFDFDRPPRMTDMTWAEGLDRPTAMAIAPQIQFSFPLARQIDAVWIDRIHSQWIAKYARMLLDREEDPDSEFAALVRGYYERDINRTIALIRDERPELIIQAIGGNPSVAQLNDELLARDPALLNDYDVIAQEGVIRILRRRNAIAANAAPDAAPGTASN